MFKWLKDKIDLFFFLGSNILFRIISGISAVFVARYFSPADLGVFRTLMAFLTLIGIIVNLGVSDFFLYKASRKYSHRVFVGASKVYLFVYLIFFPLSIVIYKSLYRANIWLVIIGYIKIILDWSFDIIIKNVQARNRFIQAALMVLGNSIAIMVPVIMLYILKLDLLGYILWLVISSGISYVVSLVIYKKTCGKWLVMKSPSLDLNLLRKSIPFFVSSFTVFVYLQSDVILLSLINGSVEVAKYTSATVIIFAAYVIPTAIYNYFLPKLIGAVDNLTKFVRFQIIFFMFVLIFMGILTTILYLRAQTLLHLIYAGKYDSSYQILRILTLGLLLHSFSFIGGASLTALGKQNTRAWIQLLAALLNVLLNMLILKELGAVGASISTLITEIFLFIGYTLFAIKEELFNNFKYKIK